MVSHFLLYFLPNDARANCEVHKHSEIPIDDWIPALYKHNTSLVVAWDLDSTKGKDVVRQLATWTVLAKPGLQHFKVAIEDIITGLQDVAKEQELTIAEITVPRVVDVDFTGSGRMTGSIFKSLQQTFKMTDAEFRPVKESAWSTAEPVLIGDVLFLPYYSMAWDAEGILVKGRQLVKRHMAGTWEREHGSKWPYKAEDLYKPVDVLGGPA